MSADLRRHRLGTGRTGGATLRARLGALAAEDRPPVRVIVPPAAPSPYVSEAAFQGVIVGLAELCGWEVTHNADSRRTQAGVPDLLLLGGPGGRRILWRELKTTRGQVHPEQLAFGRLLLRGGGGGARPGGGLRDGRVRRAG